MTTATIEVGQAVPSLSLTTDTGEEVTLDDLAGKHVVLYFYPKDDTPGCTKQACALRDNWDLFSDRDDVLLYGVSPDDEASHQKFREKYDLPFPLLVDEDHRLAEALGFWKEKNMYGKKYWGVQRATVIIGPDGTLSHVFPKVKPAEHLDLVRDALGL